MKQSMGAENRDANLKDIETLVLEKYVEEAAAAALEGLGRCKTEKDVWSAVEVRTKVFVLQCGLLTIHHFQVISALHRRFPTPFTQPLLSGLAQGLTPPGKAALAALPQDQREKDEGARVARQRPLLRVYAELALLGILADAPGRSGGETILKTIKDLVRAFIRGVWPIFWI